MGTIFHHKNKGRRVKERIHGLERWLFDRLTDFLARLGAVELLRSDDRADASEVSMTAANIKIRTQAETFKMIVTSQPSMYVLLGAVVFVAPNLSDLLGGTDYGVVHGPAVHRRRLLLPAQSIPILLTRTCGGRTASKAWRLPWTALRRSSRAS